jgi:hypothetical protein
MKCNKLIWRNRKEIILIYFPFTGIGEVPDKLTIALRHDNPLQADDMLNLSISLIPSFNAPNEGTKTRGMIIFLERAALFQNKWVIRFFLSRCR